MDTQGTEREIWFKAKAYGWGWTPATWQGWAITIGYIGIIILLAMQLDSDARSGSDFLLHFFIMIVVPTLLLIWVCYEKGERPHWSWGKKQNIE